MPRRSAEVIEIGENPPSNLNSAFAGAGAPPALDSRWAKAGLVVNLQHEVSSAHSRLEALEKAVAALQPPVATLARTVAADCEEFRAEIKDARAQLADGIELISREVARTLASVHADHKALRARAAAHEEQVRR